MLIRRDRFIVPAELLQRGAEVCVAAGAVGKKRDDALILLRRVSVASARETERAVFVEAVRPVGTHCDRALIRALGVGGTTERFVCFAESRVRFATIRLLGERALKTRGGFGSVSGDELRVCERHQSGRRMR